MRSAQAAFHLAFVRACIAAFVVNLCLFAAADPQAMRRALVGMRMEAFDG